MQIKRTALLILLGLAIGAVSTQNKRVIAQSGCSVSSFAGAYAYNIGGTRTDNRGDTFPFSAVGRLQSNGFGGFSGFDTAADGSNISKRQYSGSYLINPDCTGSATFAPAAGGAFHMDLVISNTFQNVDLIQTDSNTNVKGTAQLQFVFQALPN